MRVGYLIAAALALAGSGAATQAQEAPSLSAPDQAIVDLAIVRGKLIYAYDQAGWHGTDDLAAKLPDFFKRVGGWIVDGPAETPEIVFFDRNEKERHAIYVARFRNNRIVTSQVLGPNDDRTISEPRQRLIAARQSAITAWSKDKDSFTCSTGAANAVVLPPERPSDPILVYILTPQIDLNVIPFGGHYRIAVDANGKAGKPRPFSKSCLSMPLPDSRDGKPAVIGVTHLLDPVPTEVHVFSPYAAKSPVIVATTKPKRRLFWVENGAIRRMRDDELKGLN